MVIFHSYVNVYQRVFPQLAPDFEEVNRWRKPQNFPKSVGKKWGSELLRHVVQCIFRPGLKPLQGMRQGAKDHPFFQL